MYIVVCRCIYIDLLGLAKDMYTREYMKGEMCIRVLIYISLLYIQISHISICTHIHIFTHIHPHIYISPYTYLSYTYRICTHIHISTHIHMRDVYECKGHVHKRIYERRDIYEYSYTYLSSTYISLICI